MKVLTILIEVPDSRAREAFQETVEECSRCLVSADEASLTVRLREPEEE